MGEPAARRPYTSITHDFDDEVWGYYCRVILVLDAGRRLECGGWGRDFAAGDRFVLHRNGGREQYKVTRIEYLGVSDSVFASLEFEERLDSRS